VCRWARGWGRPAVSDYRRYIIKRIIMILCSCGGSSLGGTTYYPPAMARSAIRTFSFRIKADDLQEGKAHQHGSIPGIRQRKKKRDADAEAEEKKGNCSPALRGKPNPSPEWAKGRSLPVFKEKPANSCAGVKSGWEPGGRRSRCPNPTARAYWKNRLNERKFTSSGEAKKA